MKQAAPHHRRRAGYRAGRVQATPAGNGWAVPVAAWLLLALLLGIARPLAAQQLLDFSYADSLTRQLLNQRRWAALDSAGRAALALGTDYPALRRRLGAGALAAGRPAAALGYYGPALRQNPLDDSARVGLALAYLAYGQPGPAAWLAAPLPDSLRRALHLPRWPQFTALELEASLLSTSESQRGTGTFERLALAGRLGAWLSAEGSVSHYSQAVELSTLGDTGSGGTGGGGGGAGGGGGGTGGTGGGVGGSGGGPGSGGTGGTGGISANSSENHDIAQWQAQGLLTAQLAERWQAKSGYAYIGHDQGQRNRLGYLALAYARPRWRAQAGVYTGVLTDSVRTQADVRLMVFPLGNLRSYAFGRGSAVWSGGRTYPNGLLGAGQRLRPWLWAEAWGSLGRVPVLAEADGAYVYNLLDPLRRRGAVSLLALAGRHARLRLVYGTEQRWLTASVGPPAGVATPARTYALHTFTANLAWTW